MIKFVYKIGSDKRSNKYWNKFFVYSFDNLLPKFYKKILLYIIIMYFNYISKISHFFYNKS